jgi:suppressor for copper-sensitivity B
LKPGWKVYWRSPGDAGFPPTADWSGSENLKTAVIHWPAPERFEVLGFQTLGYTNEVVLPIAVERSDATKPIRIAGTIRYLTCKEICIPYDAEVALTLPTGDIKGPGKPSPFTHLINRFQVNVPGDGGLSGLRIEAAETWAEGGDIILRVTATATMPFQSPDLYPEGPPDNPQVLSFSKPVVALSPDRLTAQMDVRVFGAKDLTGLPPGGAIGGLAGRSLTLTLVDGRRAAEKSLHVAGTVESDGASAIALILVLAVLGGLILNLMPCVLPVLSIKLLSVVGHGGGESRTVRLSFLASAAGIITAFLILAAALVGLKAGGMIVGWGIQFQQPWFLIAMMLVITAFACNMWGFFEFRLSRWIADMGEHTSHVHGFGGHFIQGAFATLLATPCSAPFLGTAVGFALARGGLEIFSVFAALGLGLALPYLTVAAFPGLATRLPKPGPWMVTLRRILGFALAATALWLLSVLAASAGFTAAAVVGVIAALAAWELALKRPRPPLLVALAIAAFMAPGWLGEAPSGGREALSGAGPEQSETLDGLWTAFDEKEIPGLIAQGKTVFVDVTAEWCITCLVNKTFVLASEKVLAALKGDNVVVMQADWTRPDPVISAYLARHRRYGIPFNAVYGPGAPKGVVLPELLGTQAVLDAIGKAAGGKAAGGKKTG